VLLLVCGKSAGPGNAIKHSYREIICSVINECRRWNLLAGDMASFITPDLPITATLFCKVMQLYLATDSLNTWFYKTVYNLNIAYALMEHICCLTSKRARVCVCP